MLNQPGPSGAFRRMRVLLVEDEPTTATIVQAALETADFTCDTANLGEIGLALAKSFTDYDIIILDLMLPDIKGQDLLQRLRRDGVQTPVLILSGLHHLDVKLNGFRSGADDFMTKPFERLELVARVDAIVRRATGISQTPGNLR
jgi:two-component system, cell cycle response regulator CtrA